MLTIIVKIFQLYAVFHILSSDILLILSFVDRDGSNRRQEHVNVLDFVLEDTGEILNVILVDESLATVELFHPTCVSRYCPERLSESSRTE